MIISKTGVLPIGAFSTSFTLQYSQITLFLCLFSVQFRGWNDLFSVGEQYYIKYLDADYSDTRQTCHAYKVLTVNYRRKNSTKHLSPKDLFRLLGCTCTCTCIGLSLSSTTPRRVKFMVRSCLWRCDINVEKSNGYT